MNVSVCWRTVHAELAAGRPVFMAIVAANTRGSPGTLGARLLVDSDGGVAGTIGGGVMEKRLIDYARYALLKRDTRPNLQRLIHRRTTDSMASGLFVPANAVAWF